MFIAKTRQASRFASALARHFQFLRPLHSNQRPRQEYFVLVWDHPHANRAGLSATELNPPQFTFAGECLSPAGSGKPQIVQGNAFACLARNTDEVAEIMKSSAYYKQGVWDITTAQVSPLMTVHSREYHNAND